MSQSEKSVDKNTKKFDIQTPIAKVKSFSWTPAPIKGDLSIDTPQIQGLWGSGRHYLDLQRGGPI